MKRILSLSFFTDIFTKVIIRTVFWFTVILFLMLLFVFLDDTFNFKIDAREEIVQLFKLKYFIGFVITICFSVLSDFLNETFPDKQQAKFIGWLTSIKFLHIGRYFIKIHINKSENATIWPVHKIDEFIDHFYKINKGKIYLFNPPKRLLKAHREFWDIIKSINSNINNIDELVLIISNKSYNPDKNEIAEKLQIPIQKVKLVNKLPYKLQKYAESYVAGVYTGKSTLFSNGKGSDIQYFLNRPLYHPYDAKFTIVQTKDKMEKIIFPNKSVGANNLNRLLEEYIAKIEKVKN